MLASRVNGWLRRVPPWALYLAGALPPVWLLWLAISGGLGADPVKGLERQMGEWGLILMVTTLAVTPLRHLTGISIIKFRRALGLLTFFYILAHFLVWLVLDMGLLWAEAAADIFKRPYVTVGAAGFLLMLPLAMTSNNRSVRLMGAARWQQLQRLAYPAAVAGAIHYLWLVKTWHVEPLLYLGVIVMLLVLRLRRPGVKGAQA